MTLSNSESFSILQKSNKILIVIPPKASLDIISAALGLNHLLKNINKETAIFFQEDLPQKLAFLDGQPTDLIKDLSGSRDFVLIFNTEKNKILDAKIEKDDSHFTVKITPEKGSIDPKDFSFMPNDFRYDLIVLLGVPSLENLGENYFNNTDLFFEVPKLNIDNHPDNENYGQINEVDFAASSICEILSKNILKNFENSINKKTAQCLLAGIVSATDSFQKPTTTPKSLVLSAKLMKYGADQAEVIRHIYKTKSLSFLKLWGRVMARLNYDKESKTIWSLLSYEDFVQSQSDEKDLPFVMDEIRRNFFQGQIYAIIYTNAHSKIFAYIFCRDNQKEHQLAEIFSVEPSQKMLAELENENLIEAEKELLEKIKNS